MPKLNIVEGDADPYPYPLGHLFHSGYLWPAPDDRLWSCLDLQTVQHGIYLHLGARPVLYPLTLGSYLRLSLFPHDPPEETTQGVAGDGADHANRGEQILLGFADAGDL